MFDITSRLNVTRTLGSTVMLGIMLFLSVPTYAVEPLTVGINAHIQKYNPDSQAFTRELGAHSIRMAAGKYTDFAINWAAQNGKSVVLMLGYGQGLNVKTASGRQAYADRSADLAWKYGSKIEYYQVWNEWNGGFGLACDWKQPPCNDAAMYTDLLCKTYEAIKAVRPNAKVAGGVVAGANEKFITGMLNAGAGDCMDVLDVHLYVYRQNWPGHVPSDAPGSVGAQKLIQVVKDRQALVRAMTGRTIPIIVSEAGYHRNGDSTLASERRGADFITELYRQASAVPFLEGIWWFNLEDEDSRAGNFGLVRSDNSRKPGFAAFQAAANR